MNVFPHEIDHVLFMSLWTLKLFRVLGCTCRVLAIIFMFSKQRWVILEVAAWQVFFFLSLMLAWLSKTKRKMKDDGVNNVWSQASPIESSFQHVCYFSDYLSELIYTHETFTFAFPGLPIVWTGSTASRIGSNKGVLIEKFLLLHTWRTFLTKRCGIAVHLGKALFCLRKFHKRCASAKCNSPFERLEYFTALRKSEPSLEGRVPWWEDFFGIKARGRGFVSLKNVDLLPSSFK